MLFALYQESFAHEFSPCGSGLIIFMIFGKRLSGGFGSAQFFAWLPATAIPEVARFSRTKEVNVQRENRQAHQAGQIWPSLMYRFHIDSSG